MQYFGHSDKSRGRLNPETTRVHGSRSYRPCQKTAVLRSDRLPTDWHASVEERAAKAPESELTHCRPECQPSGICRRNIVNSPLPIDALITIFLISHLHTG